MTKANTHIIRKLHVEIATNREAVGRQFQREMGTYLKAIVLPNLEKQFDRYAPQQVIRLKKIVLDIDLEYTSDFKASLQQAILTQFKEQLEQLIIATPKTKENTLSILSQEEKDWETLHYFLTTGSMPWWSKNVSIHAIEKRILTAKNSVSSKVKDDLMKHREIFLQTNVVNRLHWQFTETFRLFLLKTVAKETTVWKQYSSSLASKHRDRQSLSYKILAWKTAWQLAINHPATVNKKTWQHAFDQVAKAHQKEIPVKQKLPSKAEDASIDTAIRGIAIHFGGLVLLHPFLQHLFLALNWLDAEKKVKKEYQQKAVHLLYYLATGQENPEESLLIFCKFLAAYPLEQAIEKEIILSPQEKAEADTLLRAVLKYWTALKGTSIDGLRGNFLIREGQLLKIESGWKVIMEKKAYDVLLPKIPWGFNTIKLPWIEEVLSVEW